MPTSGAIQLAAYKLDIAPEVLVARVYRENEQNLLRTAKALGVTRETVRYWLRKGQRERETHDAIADPQP